MCINWLTLPDGNWRPCHVCWQCKRDRVSDWVGRCIAESETSRETLRLTLTYGRDDRYRVDHPRSQMLHYEDVQGYLKRLRYVTDGRVRFFATGEYGAARARAHWHLILFFSKGIPPDVRLEERYVHKPGGRKLWPYGFSYWEQADPEKMRYAVKYILKDEVGGFDRVHRFSSRPEIGHEHFRQVALRYALQQLPPQASYRFPNDWKRDGTPREYRLSRAALYRFLQCYDDRWQELYGNDNWPQSDLMDAYVEERNRRRRLVDRTEAYSDADFMRRFEMEKWGWHVGTDDTKMFHPLDVREVDRYRRASKGT